MSHVPGGGAAAAADQHAAANAQDETEQIIRVRCHVIPRGALRRLRWERARISDHLTKGRELDRICPATVLCGDEEVRGKQGFTRGRLYFQVHYHRAGFHKENDHLRNFSVHDV